MAGLRLTSYTIPFLAVGFMFATLLNVRLTTTEKNHRLSKRQTSAPTFGQSSYTFNPSTCNVGNAIGTVTATTGGGQVGYTIDPGSSCGTYVVIGYLTGYLTFASSAPGGPLTFNVQATNTLGTTSTPVTVTCTGGTSSVGSSTCTNVAATTISPFLAQSSFLTNPALTSSALTNPYASYPYSSGVTNPYASYPYTSGVTNPYSTYPYTSGVTNPYASYPYTSGTTYPYGITSPYGSTSTGCSSTSTLGLGYPYSSALPTTPQTFYVTNCYAGGYVGQVCYPGASGYILSGSSQFTISSSNGIITLLAPITATPYPITATVQVYTAYSPSTPITIPVTVTASCYGTNSLGTGTGTFLQTAYYFTSSSCTAGSTVGAVSAPGALSYILTSGTGQFAVSSTGIITVATTVAAGTYTLLVQAYSYTGIPSTATVTVTVTGCTGTTTGAATFPQASYTLSSSACTAGTNLGTVTATSATSYQINYSNTAQFAVSSTGQITLLSAIPAGTYSLTLTATGALGSASVPVTITITCGGTGTTGTGANPTWNQNFYAFTLNSCTSGATVGSVSASGATSYAINYGGSQFTINASGGITSSGTLTAGVYSLTAVATGSSGAQIAVPVTVNVVCSG